MSPRREAMALVALLALAAALRLPALGEESLWYDEVATAEAVSKSSLGRVIAVTRNLDASTPPLHPIVLWGWARLAGHSERALRLPSAIFGLVGIGFLWAGARRWASPRAALVATALAAGLPHLVRFHREARAYALAFALAALAGWLLARVYARPRPRACAAYALATLLLLLTHYTGYWVAAAWLAATAIGRRKQAFVSTAAAVAAALPVSFLYTDWQRSGLQTAWLGSSGWTDVVTSYLMPSLPLPPPEVAVVGAWLFAAALALALAGVASGRGLPRRFGVGGAGTVLLLWILVPLFAPDAARLLLGRPFGGTARYVTVATPALLTLVGWGIARLRAPLPGVVAAVSAAGLALVSAALLRADEKPDWRAAVDALAERREDEPIFVQPSYDRRTLRYLMDGRPSGVHGLSQDGAEALSILEEAPEPARIWWVVARLAPQYPRPELPAPLLDRYAACDLEPIVGVEVQLLVRKADAAVASDPCEAPPPVAAPRP